MSYDPGLEARVDELCDDWDGFRKKKMFGGIGYLKDGNMAFGIWKDLLIVRCGPDLHAECLARPHARPFDVTGRSMTGWVMVAPEGIEEDASLIEWMDLGRWYAGSLPPK